MNIIEELQIENESSIKTSEKTSMKMKDFFKDGIEDIESFNKKAWTKKRGILLPNYKNMTEMLEGLDDGLYLFAGPSNHGKCIAFSN